MSSPRYRQGAYPIEYAFVVQFAADSAADAERLSGRVEHVVSGQAHRFESAQELLKFLEKVLQKPVSTDNA